MFANLFGSKSAILDSLPQIKGKYIENAKLAKYTWLGVGGPAEVLFLPHDLEDLKTFLIRKPKEIPVTVIGGGSNLLVRDGGIPGVVVKLDTPDFTKCSVNGAEITVGAGMKNVDLKKILLKNQIGGLEFVCSIPGRIGGLFRTNAGCFGKSLSDVFVKAHIIDEWGKVCETTADDFNFSYRASMFPENWIILDVTLKGEFLPSEQIKIRMDEQLEFRRSHQPINKKTAGSTFKNPEGLQAWRLIKDAGCVGLKVGDAEVSSKHCNFLINNGKATAQDIEELGELVIEKVKRKTEITLEWEVRRMGVKK